MKKLLLTATALVGLTGIAAAQDMGNAENGKTVFNRCMGCHQIGPNAANGFGPQLNGVVDRAAGTAEGYTYSDAMANSGLTWDDATLHQFLAAPMQFLPGTKMPFGGIPNDQEIADVIAYLAQFGPDGNTM